jgi:uncharacterized membrane protein YgdD (TMEM256/DUF423 family)
MTARLAATTGALLGGLAVALGAFGAHALKARLSAAELETYETAVRYQMYHALALLAAAWLISRNAPGASSAALFFLIGVVLFSGSLYLLVATGVTALGIVTPFGGLALIAGWAMLAWGSWKG